MSESEPTGSPSGAEPNPPEPARESAGAGPDGAPHDARSQAPETAPEAESSPEEQPAAEAADPAEPADAPDTTESTDSAEQSGAPAAPEAAEAAEISDAPAAPETADPGRAQSAAEPAVEDQAQPQEPPQIQNQDQDQDQVQTQVQPIAEFPAGPADESPTVVTPTQPAAAQSAAAEPYFAPPGPAQGHPEGTPQAAPPGYPQVSPQAYPQGVPQGYPQGVAPGQSPWQYPSQTGQPALGMYTSAEYLTAPKVKRSHKKFWWISTSVVVALALIAAGVFALLPGRTGNSIVAKVACKTTDLASCLIKEPLGALQYSSAGDPWSHQTSADANQYQAAIAHDTPGIGSDDAAFLGADTLRTLVHTDWNAVDGDDVDLVLLKFDTQKGAQAWQSTRTAEILAAYKGSAVTIPGDTTAKAYTGTTVDAQGNVDAAYSTLLGNIVFNVTYSSPKQLSAQDLKTWAGTELASLRTAPAAPADPADAGSGTEQVACAAGLTTCLMPMPAGGERWSTPESKLWVRSTALTVNQYVQLSWKDSDQAQVSQNFSADGITGVVHDDWATDDDDKQADVYLVQAITAAGATKLASTNYGEPQWDPGLTGTSYSIAGEPDAQAWYTNKDKDGLVEFYYLQTFGNVIVEGWEFFYGSFDSGTATKWAQTELNLVSKSVTTQEMGLFPLTAPTLPAAAQGTCPTAGDCLMPLPAGATDTTSTSYYVSEGLQPTDFFSQYSSGVPNADAATWLKSDGFKEAGHRSWDTAGGAAVDTVLLKYGTSAQAKAATLAEYGGNLPGERVCTDAAVPDSMCLATVPGSDDLLQSETIWVLAWKGDYEVSVSVTTGDEADVADAYAYAQQQLDLLPAS